jgi:ribonuclease HII
MLIYAGIDEAGYGPLLGPLCVACSAFVIEDHDPDVAGGCDLWKKLKKAVCRKRTDRRRRIAIEDSKKLKGANQFGEEEDNGEVTGSSVRRKSKPLPHPLKHLERGVLAFNATRIDRSPSPGPSPSCDDQLLQHLNVSIGSAPWYSSATPIPVAHTADELRIASSRLGHVMNQENVRCEALCCEAIDADSFNRQCQAMGSKASVNFCAVMRLIDSVWQRWPNDHPRIIVDRQGGRTRYMQDLLAAYPDAHIQILAETETLSRYRLERNGSHLTVSFLVEAEAAHLPVALASMIAKYVRELLMMRLNRYFQGLMPELKATAGYYGDARRYISDIEPLIARLGVDRSNLIRSV